MATQRRSTKKRVVRFYTVLAVTILFGAAIGFAVGRFTVPIKTITITETVEVSALTTEALVDTEEVKLFDVPLSNSLQRYLYEICADKEVPVTLALAMIEYESQFNPEIISTTNDYGLMQINAVNHEWLEKKYRTANMLNPYQNVFCGVSIIGEYIEKYGDYEKALMAYNMGDYGAQKAWESGVTNTTYSDTVLGLMQEYEVMAHDK